MESSGAIELKHIHRKYDFGQYIFIPHTRGFHLHMNLELDHYASAVNLRYVTLAIFLKQIFEGSLEN